ncbi:bile acid:Na+ symporter, BASS family [Nocardia amikacinitolerans]|uniref:bile acid:sodium symporter family protein n=1 Tax=Nocardia amikacinitolerans TaxID=756689 RepID=UPI00082A5624|nr:bile acid:sodium symporter family protein [Nocardia amikacinitolerans]MCP2321419.1 bile acid:Na+ symporter, BASS family [Nocardia amikacinitolerans]
MIESPLVTIGLPITCFFLMIGIGLTLTPQEFSHEIKHPKAILVASVAQLLLMPALSFVIAWTLSLPPLLAIGLVTIAACPGAATAPVMTYLARANVHLSIVLTVVNSMLIIVSLPILVNLAIDSQPVSVDEAIVVPVPRTMALLFGVVLVPVMLGMVIRARVPNTAARMEKAVSIFGAIELVALIVAIMISLGSKVFEYLAQAGVAVALLNLGGIAIGIGVLTLARLPVGSRIAGGMELGIKNGALGMVIAIAVVGSEEVAVPFVAYGIVMYFSASMIVLYVRHRARSSVHVVDGVTV